MHLVLCYDVVDDRRRTRFFKGLKAFLTPVQKSVFEGLLPDQRYGALLDLVERLIDPGTDTVRIYHLCGGCRGLIDLFGVAERADLEKEDVII